MNILLIGGGGRENALAWKIAGSESFKANKSKLFCAPGNPGISAFAECVNIQFDNVEALIEFAKDNKIELAVIGPEIPLASGLADGFRKQGLLAFGPGKMAAEIESSKQYAKELMKKNGIPTASFETFARTDRQRAAAFIESSSFPLVFKADGLAAGKGVVIADNLAEAMRALDEMTEGSSFGNASEKFVIEEYLFGEEVSVFCITDGDSFVLLPFSRDHKRIGDGDTGKNTGGMGAVSPVRKFMTQEMTQKIEDRIVKPVLKAMREEGRKFTGCLYCGLMICNGEPYVIEFNCRFGDPETQSVLPLISSDFLQMLHSSAAGKMSAYELSVNGMHSCCIIAASGGYPDKFDKGFEISGISSAEKTALVFHSGTAYSGGKTVTAGGRVLSVVGLSEMSLEDAIVKAYEAISHIEFKNMYYRKDIGEMHAGKGSPA